MPDDRRPPRPPAPAASIDPELRESLELVATLVASMSDRVDGQAHALDRIAKVLAETRTAAFTARKHTDPARTAEQVAQQVERYVLPSAKNLAETVLALTRETATTCRAMEEARALRRDTAALKEHEAREARRWRDRRRTLLLWTGPALLALLLLAAVWGPRVLAMNETLCTLVGGLPLGGVSPARPGCWFPVLW